MNLRRRLPYRPETFDFIYTSHVLDHLEPRRIGSLLEEIYACLRPGGVFRVSVPDLETAAIRYLRSAQENRHKPLHHHWHTIELLDQMTRTEPGGEKARFLRYARSQPELASWLRPQLGYEMLLHLDQGVTPKSAIGLLKRAAAALIRGMRRFEATGERHLWMFDEIGLVFALRQAGFSRVERLTWDQSLWIGHLEANLDSHQGLEYKPGSLYVEGVKA